MKVSKSFKFQPNINIKNILYFVEIMELNNMTKKKVWIVVNHDGPIFYDTDYNEIEKELKIDDMTSELDDWNIGFPCWIDSDDFKKKNMNILKCYLEEIKPIADTAERLLKMCGDKIYSLGQLSYTGAIVNPEMIIDKEVAEKYKKAVDEMFKNLSIIMTLPKEHFPDLAEKAYHEQFGK